MKDTDKLYAMLQRDIYNSRWFNVSAWPQRARSAVRLTLGGWRNPACLFRVIRMIVNPNWAPNG